MQIHLKVKFRLFPGEVIGLVSAVQRAVQHPPLRTGYTPNMDFLAELIAYAAILDYDRRLRTSSVLETWSYKDAGKRHVYTMPTVVAMAVWRFLCQSGHVSHDEQALLAQLDQQLVNGHLLRPNFDPRPLQLT